MQILCVDYQQQVLFLLREELRDGGTAGRDKRCLAQQAQDSNTQVRKEYAAYTNKLGC